MRGPADSARTVSDLVHYGAETRALIDHCIDGLYLRPESNYERKYCLDRKYVGDQVIEVGSLTIAAKTLFEPKF